MPTDRFAPWIEDVTQRFGMDILRTKGIIAMKEDDQRFVIQGVHMLVEGGRASVLGSRARRANERRLVFIGRDVPRDMLKRRFEARRALDHAN